MTRPAGGTPTSTVYKAARTVVRVLLVLVTLALVLIGYAVYEFKKGLEPEDAPDVDKAQRLPAVSQAHDDATRDIDAAFAAFADKLGPAYVQRTQSTLDECGSERGKGGFMVRVTYGPVTCQREVVRYYVVDGPRADLAPDVVAALYATGLYGKYPPRPAQVQQDCTSPPTPSGAATPPPGRTPRPAYQLSETPCTFDTGTAYPSPARQIRADLRTYAPTVAQTPLRQARALDVVAAQRSTEPADLRPDFNADASAPQSLLAISVLVTYYIAPD